MTKIESLKEDLKSKNNTSEIKKEIKKKMKDIHPDTNGGEFKSEEDKILYAQLAEAKKEKNEDQLPAITNSELVAIVKSLSINNSKIDLEQTLERKTEKNYNSYKSSHSFPKISLTAVTTVFTIIWLFPAQVSEHTVLSRFIDVSSYEFTLLWLLSLGVTGIYWMMINLFERLTKEYLERIKTESFQNNLFLRFKEYINERYEGGTFTKNEFNYFLMNSGRHTRTPITLVSVLRNRTHIDLEVAQSIADIIFQRAEEKELIEKLNTKSLEDEFIFII